MKFSVHELARSAAGSELVRVAIERIDLAEEQVVTAMLVYPVV
jgi:hypothetical protein